MIFYLFFLSLSDDTYHLYKFIDLTHSGNIKCINITASNTYTGKKKLTLKSNPKKSSESTMCFVVESVRIQVDSTRKLNLMQYKI